MDYDGLIISGGPGDPMKAQEVIQNVRKVQCNAYRLIILLNVPFFQVIEVAVGCTNPLWTKCCSDISAAWNIPHVVPVGFVSSPIVTTRLYRPWCAIHGKHDDHNYHTSALKYPVLFHVLCDLRKEQH